MPYINVGFVQFFTQVYMAYHKDNNGPFLYNGFVVQVSNCGLFCITKNKKKRW
jgi:hypothetical protein